MTGTKGQNVTKSERKLWKENSRTRCSHCGAVIPRGEIHYVPDGRGYLDVFCDKCVYDRRRD